MDRIPDPYRELGILRGATDAQVKAAHRRLAKRFHPDGPEGDHDRFLAIQEAYSLLSDPLRRRDWDARHTSGPVRAGEPGRPRGGRPPSARTTRGAGADGMRRDGSKGSGGAPGPGAGSEGNAGSAAGSAGSAGPAGSAAGSGGSRRSGSTRSRGSADARHAAGAAGDPEHPGGPWSASDRDPSTRSTTWSAASVPWWEDFSPRDRGAGTAGAGSSGSPPRASGSASGRPGAAGSTTGAAPGAPGAPPGTGTHRTTAKRSPEDVDVYSRSSGAAWSMAARRYFRKGEAELPSGGAWTYRGTQVVTGAEARKVAAETEAEQRRAAEAERRRATETEAERRRTADAEAERRRAAEALLRSRAATDAAPRTAFGHEEGRAAGPRADAPPPGRASEARPASSRPATETPPRQAAPPAPVDAGVASEEGSFLRRVRKVLRLGD